MDAIDIMPLLFSRERDGLYIHLERNISMLFPRVLDVLAFQDSQIFTNSKARRRWFNNVIHETTLRRDLS
jgi:hypothetical protein